MTYDRYETANYILPTGTSINPATGEGEYSDPSHGQVLFVMFKLNDKRTRPTRVFSSYGSVRGWELGTKHSCRHDQTNAFLGDYEVVGIVHEDGTKEGNVPSIKIKHSVFK
jgi:hypothetical protein